MNGMSASSVPPDLHRLIGLSSSWRKLLMIIAVPAALIGLAFLAQGRILATTISFGVAGLTGWLALKPKNVRGHAVVILLTRHPDTLARVFIMLQAGYGARSATLLMQDAKKNLLGTLLIDKVQHLDEAIAIIQRRAPHASIETQKMNFSA